MGMKNIANITRGSEAWEQLMALKGLSHHGALHALHEAQIIQLKIWPRILFQTSTKSMFKADIADKKLIFDVEVTGKQFKPKRGERIINPEHAPIVLDEWVKALLGKDWDITINVKAHGGKTTSFHYKAQEVKRESVDDLCARLTKDKSASRQKAPK